MRKDRFLYVFAIAIIILLPISARASLGVGVGLGKIRIEEPLRPGMVHKLAELPVLNTGDEQSDYEITVTFHRDQPEFRPPSEWFIFTPKLFSLEPGGVQLVEIKISLPLKGVKPGDYFAYLEAGPAPKEEIGATRIGIAAATQLWFTVAPANLWQAIYYRASYKIGAFWAFATPWIWFVIILVAGAIIIAILKRFFNFQVQHKK